MYEKYKLKNSDCFDIYAYAPPNNGTIQYGKKFIRYSDDLRTVKSYKDYLNCGFNVLMAQTTATYKGEDFNTSDAKLVLDNAYKAGIKKVILLDDRIGHLSHVKDGIVGKGKQFKNNKELDKYIASCLAPYKDHPAFYGVQFWDEPHYYYFKSMGELYRSIKRVRPETYIQANLLPLDTLRWMDERYPKGGTLIERREKYLNLWLDETGADYILYDDYPFSPARDNKIYYLRCLQTSANVCKTRKVKFCFVAQSFSMKIGKNDYYYVPSQKEALFQVHLLMGFGLKSLSYFTYMPHGCSALEGEFFPLDGALCNERGEKMPQYFIVKKAIGEVKKLLPVIYHFNYVGSTYDVASFSTWLKPLDLCLKDKMHLIESFKVDKEGVFINELIDKNNNYLYRVINVTDTNVKELANIYQKTEIKFNKKVKVVDVYKNGKWTTIKLVNNTYVASLLPGQAVYILTNKGE